MESSTANQLTSPGDQNFFLSPQFPMQRQYEALRAYLVEDEPSADVARRFGYSPGAFRVLCHQFRHDPQKRASFFRQPQRGPQSCPARDRVRDLAVAMRKRNLSVYDMQRELAADGHSISINSLTVLLREEGFSRLPRRSDDVLTRPNAKLDPEIRIALRLGAFQLLHMDRIPARAAIDESVELAQQTGHHFASGMVNAVLRKMVRYKQTLDSLSAPANALRFGAGYGHVTATL